MPFSGSISVGLLAVVALLAVAPATAFHNAPEFTLDLDKAPNERWDGAVKIVLDLHPWSDSFEPVFTHYNHSLYRHLTPQNRSDLVAVVQKRWNEHYEEITGLAKQFAQAGHPEVDVSYLCFFSFFHELDHASNLGLPWNKMNADGTPKAPKGCTGIVVVPTDDKENFIHGRNLDQSVPAGRNVTLQIQVMKGGKPMYQAVDFYWFTSGYVTATKYGGVTLQENWRFTGENSRDRYNTAHTFDEILTRILRNPLILPQVYMFREIMEKVIVSEAPFSPVAFYKARDYLLQAEFAGPFYCIMTGPARKASILSISYDNRFNNITTLDQDDWFLVQTNYEPWLPDKPSDPRRTFAEAALCRLGQDDGATKLGVWQAISEYPVHNFDTFYTTLMSVDYPKVRGFIREAMVPVKGKYPD